MSCSLNLINTFSFQMTCSFCHILLSFTAAIIEMKDIIITCIMVIKHSWYWIQNLKLFSGLYINISSTFSKLNYVNTLTYILWFHINLFHKVPWWLRIPFSQRLKCLALTLCLNIMEVFPEIHCTHLIRYPHFFVIFFVSNSNWRTLRPYQKRYLHQLQMSHPF